MESSLLWVVAGLVLAAGGCGKSGEKTTSQRPSVEPPAITLSVTNGQPSGPLELVADQTYVFDRIILSVENREIGDSRRALEWLRKESVFRVLKWDGVRETGAYWRNYRDSRLDADLFSHVFQEATWMQEPNSVELAILDAEGKPLSNSLRLSSTDFLNRLKQSDFDRIRAEFRYENFTVHKDIRTARRKRAVAKIVFAIQINRSKQLRVPATAHSLRLVWDKNPSAPVVFPIQFLTNPYPYGAKLQVQVEPEKAVYMPGDKLRATFTLLGQDGTPLKFAEYAKNGITQVTVHLDGPVQEPTFYHEEWLADFRGHRYAYHLRAPAVGLGKADEALNTPLDGPPLDPTGTQLITDLHVPENLPQTAFGTFQIGATATRSYASQNSGVRLEKPIQVGRQEVTYFEKFACASCHVPNTPLDIGLLMPPMVGSAKLRVEDFQDCVMCHDNSRNGSRRLDKYLHLIHFNLPNPTVAKNNCVVCHLTAASIRKVGFEVCSNCHDALHQNNRPNYSDNQCQDCHSDFAHGHVAPASGSAVPSKN